MGQMGEHTGGNLCWARPAGVGGRGKPCDCHVMWSRKNLSHVCCQGSGQQLRGATVRRKHPLFIQSLLCEVFFCFESINRSVVSNSLQHHEL